MTTSPTARRVYCCYTIDGDKKRYSYYTLDTSKQKSKKKLETEMNVSWRKMRKTMNVDVELVDVFVVKHES